MDKKPIDITLPIEELKPHPKNSNKHSNYQIKAMADSIREFGFTQPVLISKDNVILAGHARTLAAKQVGLKELPCRRFDHYTDEQARAYIIADNQLARLAEWDHKILASEIVELDKLDVDINVLGFDDKEMARIRDLVPDAGWDIEPVDNSKDDDIPDTKENIHNVERGQIWQLGEHRLMCGDSTSKDDVDKLMCGEKADMVFTDPPYGISYDDKKHRDNHKLNKGMKSSRFGMIKNDDKEFIFPDLDIEEQFWWGANYYCQQLPKGGVFFVWDKKTEAMQSNGMLFTNDFELCWSKKKHKQEIVRKVWAGAINKEKGEDRLHPTQKPIDLCCFFLEKFSKDIVLDLFLGSGSTLIACEKTNRKCYGMEIDPHYCSVIIERWQNYTGKTAQLLEPISPINGDDTDG